MKIVEHGIEGLHAKTIGFTVDYYDEVEWLYHNPAWVISITLYFIKWEYRLEIHSSRTKGDMRWKI